MEGKENNSQEKIIEVGFEEIGKEKEKLIYIPLSDVAKLLREPESTIRVWCNKFDSILHIERSGRNRMFRQEDIDKLIYIQSLIRDKGFSHNQVLDKLTEEENGNLEIAITKEDPLAIQALAVALTKEMKDNMNEMINQMITRFEEKELEVQKLNQIQIDKLESTINTLTEKLDSYFVNIDAKELEAKNRDNEILDLLKTKMENRQEERKSKSQGKSSGFFSKLFGGK